MIPPTRAPTAGSDNSARKSMSNADGLTLSQAQKRASGKHTPETRSEIPQFTTVTAYGASLRKTSGR